MSYGPVRSVSRRAQIAYEYESGEVEYDDIEDPLPFDKNADVIEIKDDDYGLWYRDFAENTDDYIGKTVKIRVLTLRNKLINAKNEIIVGRQIMTCCADDISYRGVVAKGAPSLKVATRDWLTVEGKLSEEYSKLYRGRGPVLTVTKLCRADKPIEEVATFY